MARECFCGCGLRVRGIQARISKRGAGTLKTVEALRLWEPPLRRGAESGSEDCRQSLEQLDEFCNEGEYFAEQLSWVVHGDLAATDIDRKQLAAWQKTAIRLMAYWAKWSHENPQWNVTTEPGR